MVEGVAIPDSEDAALMGGSWLSWGWAVGDCMCVCNPASVAKDGLLNVAVLGGQMGHSKVPSGRSQERSWSMVGSPAGWIDAPGVSDTPPAV